MATEALETVETPETPETPVVETPAPETPPATPPVTPPAAEVPKPPIEYKLVLPKDSVLPVASIDKTVAIARELGLSNEAAQKVIESFNAVLADEVKSDAEAWKPGTGTAWKARDAEWKADALKDAEIGGTPEKLSASVDKANLVIAKFGRPSVAEFLKETGLGSNKDFIHMFAKIGRSMSEGSLVLGSPPAVVQRTHEQILYERDKPAA